MREILYRGKTPKTREWVFGNYVETSEEYDKDDINYAIMSKENAHRCMGEYCDNAWEEVLPETVGQFTKLISNNGKKIFEGDIVKCYRYANGKDGELVFENLVVVWDDMDACFGLAEIGVGHISYRYNDYQMDDTHEFEVIGNIYDNLEFLEDNNG